MDPSDGNVRIGSGKLCMGFTLNKFAQIYSSKFGIDKEKMMKKLWGDNFFDISIIKNGQHQSLIIRIKNHFKDHLDNLLWILLVNSVRVLLQETNNNIKNF